jgi:hypothetical protein
MARPSGNNQPRGQGTEVTGMQYIEASVIGVRSAVITLKRRATPLRFVLIRYYPMQAMMSRIRWDHLVDQITSLDLEGLGVPVQWEYVVDDRVKNGREQAVAKVADSAAAVVMRVLGRYGSPLGLPSMEQADEHDDRWERLAGGRLGRAFESQTHARDSQLVQALGVIHAERQNEATKVAVVFGAAHIPAVVDYLTATFRYYVENAVWLTVAHAPD